MWVQRNFISAAALLVPVAVVLQWQQVFHVYWLLAMQRLQRFLQINHDLHSECIKIIFLNNVIFGCLLQMLIVSEVRR